jgi:two-component system, OmpR family, sensor histidine kinase KdpD
VLSGDDVAQALIDYARSRNISKIIVGKPGKPKFTELLFGTFIDKLAHKCGDIDLYLISGQVEGQARPPAPRRIATSLFEWKGLLWAAATVGLCTAINAFLFEHMDPANLIMVYLLGVAWLAFRYGRRISLAGTLLSVVCFDFFFVPPFYSFSVLSRGHIITFAVMVVVGWLIGSLTGRLRRQTLSIGQREEKTQVLYSLSRDLAASSRPDELLQTLLSHVQSFFKCPAVVFVENRANGTLSLLTAVSDGRDLAANEHTVAAWAHAHRRPAGKGTDTLSASHGMYMPLVGTRDAVGVLGVFPADEKLFHDPDNSHILELFVKQTALAVEGALLAESNIKSEAQMERARLSNMLFDTFSHDFKDSLQAISKSAAALLDSRVADTQKREELVREIVRQADQLDTLTSELPKVIHEPQ